MIEKEQKLNELDALEALLLSDECEEAEESENWLMTCVDVAINLSSERAKEDQNKAEDKQSEENVLSIEEDDRDFFDMDDQGFQNAMELSREFIVNGQTKKSSQTKNIMFGKTLNIKKDRSMLLPFQESAEMMKNKNIGFDSIDQSGKQVHKEQETIFRNEPEKIGEKRSRSNEDGMTLDKGFSLVCSSIFRKNEITNKHNRMERLLEPCKKRKKEM